MSTDAYLSSADHAVASGSLLLPCCWVCRAGGRPVAFPCDPVSCCLTTCRGIDISTSTLVCAAQIVLQATHLILSDMLRCWKPYVVECTFFSSKKTWQTNIPVHPWDRNYSTRRCHAQSLPPPYQRTSVLRHGDRDRGFGPGTCPLEGKHKKGT